MLDSLLPKMATHRPSHSLCLLASVRFRLLFVSFPSSGSDIANPLWGWGVNIIAYHISSNFSPTILGSRMIGLT